MGRDALEKNWHQRWLETVKPKWELWFRQRKNENEREVHIQNDIIDQIIRRLNMNLTVDNKCAINLTKRLKISLDKARQTW